MHPEGSGMHLQSEDCTIPGLEMNVVHLRDHDFRVEHGGVSMNVTVSAYSKVNFVPINTLCQAQEPDISTNLTVRTRQRIFTNLTFTNSHVYRLSGPDGAYSCLACIASSSL